MANSEEEIRIRLGFQADAVTRGTQAMLGQQKKSALDYVAFWKKATDEREASEIAAQEKLSAIALAGEKERNRVSIAMARASAVEKSAARTAYFEEQAAQAAIARGSGAFGSLEAGAEGAAIAGTLAGGAKELGREMHGSATALREVQVLIHEGLRGNFKRMIGSASILASAMGVLGLVMTGLAITLPLTAFVGYKAWETFKARGEAEQSGKDLDKRMEDATEIARRRIEELVRTKVIDAKQKNSFDLQLKDGGLANVSSVLDQVNKLALSIPAAEQKTAREKEIGRIDEENSSASKELDNLTKKTRTMAELNADIAEKTRNIAILKERISVAQDGTVGKANAELNVTLNQIELEKDKLELKQQQDKLNSAATDLARRIGQNERKIDEQGAEFPTIEKLAKRRGYFGNLAREFERAKADQINARENATDIDYFDEHTLQNVHISRADQIRAAQTRENAARGKLEDANVIAPELNLQKLVENTNAMIAKLNAIHGRGGKEDPIYLAEDQ